MSSYPEIQEPVAACAHCCNAASSGEFRLELFDINWDDVLIPKMSSHLSLKDLFNLRCCSPTAKRFAEAALEWRKEINLSNINTGNIVQSFRVLIDCCRHIEELDLSHNYWMTDDLLIKICKNNPRLREISLIMCGFFTAKGIQAVLECPELYVLRMSKNDWFTSDVALDITVNKTKVQQLDIGHSLSMDEKGFIVFLQKFPELSLLLLTNSPLVTDHVLFSIALNCSSLEYIGLIRCVGITNRGINILAAGCKKLKSLKIKYCPYVTEESILLLRKRMYVDRPKRYRNNVDAILSR